MIDKLPKQLADVESPCSTRRSAAANLPEPPDIETWRALVETTFGPREYDATFLQTWRLPERLGRGSGPLSVTVRNDGLLPWEQGKVKRAGWLEDPVSETRLPATERPWEIPHTLLKGEEADIAWEPPADWPAGRYTLRFDLLRDENAWFTSLGDSAPRADVLTE